MPTIYASPTTAATLLATKKFASEFRRKVGKNSREPRERHSTGPEAKSEAGHDIASDVCSLKTEDRRKRNVGGIVLQDLSSRQGFEIRTETLADHVSGENNIYQGAPISVGVV